MYPTITDLIYDLTGQYVLLPIQTYGFFLALGCVASIFWFVYEFKRLERLGIFKSATKDFNYDNPIDKISIITTIMLGFFIGNSLISIILNFNSLTDRSLISILLSKGNIIAGAVGATLAAAKLVQKSKGLAYIERMFDIVAPAIIIGYAISCLGCHFSGDGDWGKPNLLENLGLPNWAWSYDYPNNVLGRGVQFEMTDGTISNRLEQGVWPTSVYEFLLGIGIFSLLLTIRNKTSMPGLLFCMFLILYGIETFLIEFLILNKSYTLGMSSNQIYSIALIGLGFILMVYFKRRAIRYPSL